MEERSGLISKLSSDFKTRAAYIQAKVGTLVPSQIRALRLKSEMPRQSDLANAAEMHQSRISMFETPGANPTIGTLSSIAAALKVGLKIEFVPFSEMLQWENEFSQDQFKVTKIDDDLSFLSPTTAIVNTSPQVRGWSGTACSVQVTVVATGDSTTVFGGGNTIQVSSGIICNSTDKPASTGQLPGNFSTSDSVYCDRPNGGPACRIIP